MVSPASLLVALAAYVKATPVATAPEAVTTSWTSLDVPNEFINWDGIDMEAFNDTTSWKQETYPDYEIEDVEGTSPKPAKDGITLYSGPCEQGACPDHHATFDLLYSFVAVPVPPSTDCPGCPPLTTFESRSVIRVNDCGKCMGYKVGTNLGLTVPGGCWSFKACGRDQVICVDPGKSRSHRIWKDKGHKTCYKMKSERLGSCGFIKTRILVSPNDQTACNW